MMNINNILQQTNNEFDLSSNHKNSTHGKYIATGFHLSSNGQAHIISPSKDVPQGFICIGRALDSTAKNQESKDYKLVLFRSTGDLVYPFNPKKEHNMTIEEKVTSWMQHVPIEVDNEEQNKLQCFRGSPQTSSTMETDSLNYPTTDDIIEFQSNQITKQIIQQYRREQELSLEEETQQCNINEYQCYLRNSAREIFHVRSTTSF